MSRQFYPGMGEAVAQRTILRTKEDGVLETWADVAERVADGNTSLGLEGREEYEKLKTHLSNATILMSGRHLQHGDASQDQRSGELFTNCSTSFTSFILFYLLMNGSGVGRSYDDDLMTVDWNNAPQVRCVLSENHPDFDFSAHESVDEATHKYNGDKDVFWWVVEDSREGWAQALEVWEHAAFEKIHKDKTLILDFSNVRPRGTPIQGMQNRPASGPVPLMNAFNKASTVKGVDMPKWRQAMFIDHAFSECVLVGGARRSARMSTKFWKDPGIIEYIKLKAPLHDGGRGFLWSSNNSVTVDAEFWEQAAIKNTYANYVFNCITECSYKTGEPGIINVDKLKQDVTGLKAGNKLSPHHKYKLREETEVYIKRLSLRSGSKKYMMITNPCGEVALNLQGGYCVIGDLAPYHADTLEEVLDSARVLTRALIRVNTMNYLYDAEVKRTNRIGVSLTGVHEFAWKFFNCSFHDLISYDGNDDCTPLRNDCDGYSDKDAVRNISIKSMRNKAAGFWLLLAELRQTVVSEAIIYSKKLGLNTPHTMLTVKPSGSVSKLFGLTEGWHLPSKAWYLRWVAFSSNDPLVAQYQRYGYPTKELKTYKNTTIVGFPTQPVISGLVPADKLVCAAQATPEEQYKWLQLGEKYWLGETFGNQISYTLKYNPEAVTLTEFRKMLLEHQSKIKCCSVMPQMDNSAYEYQPEQDVTKAEFEALIQKISSVLTEEVDYEHIGCSNGACPVDFSERAKVS
jgi:ribonucleoside-triphosphate reductase (formate)